MLGIILKPYGQIPGAYPSGIIMSTGGDGTYLDPCDASYGTRGEAGMYHDTQLGGWWNALTDFDVAEKTGRLGVGQGGWTAFADNLWPGSWTPPNGYRPQGVYAPQPIPLGHAGLQLRDSAPAQPTPADMIAALNAHNQKIFTLSVISTVAVALSALFTTYRTTRLLREDRRRQG